MHMKFALSAAASVCASVLLCASAGATPITSGGSVAASMVQVGSLTYVGGTGSTVAFTSQPAPGLASTFSGTYVENVFRDTGNTLCGTAGQCLTFIIQVNNNSSSTDAIETATTGPFSNLFTYNVGYNNATPAGTNPAGGKAPIVINDSSTGTLQFDFRNVGTGGNIIMPGQSSSYLIIQTSAIDFTAGSLSFQDNQTATVAGYIPAVGTTPVSPTPEPSSFALLGTGLLGALGVARKRFA